MSLDSELKVLHGQVYVFLLQLRQLGLDLLEPSLIEPSILHNALEFIDHLLWLDCDAIGGDNTLCTYCARAVLADGIEEVGELIAVFTLAAHTGRHQAYRG